MINPQIDFLKSAPMQLRDSLRRTKIVATIGPATSSPEMLKAIIEAGATTLRLNFSHGTHADHQRSIRLIRQTAFELNQTSSNSPRFARSKNSLGASLKMVL